MQLSQNSKELADRLHQLSETLNLGIHQAIENPLLFADGAALSGVEALCAGIAASVPEPGRQSDPAIEHLIWQVRARAGRLQRLLDSASRFYATCFSTPQSLAMTGGGAEGLAYGVQGEWGQTLTSGHLVFDC